MTPETWKTVGDDMAGDVSLQQLDDDLERVPQLTEDERAAMWLYAWAARENAARVGRLALV
jgi:hypothetical protein